MSQSVPFNLQEKYEQQSYKEEELDAWIQFVLSKRKIFHCVHYVIHIRTKRVFDEDSAHLLQLLITHFPNQNLASRYPPIWWPREHYVLQLKKQQHANRQNTSKYTHKFDTFAALRNNRNTDTLKPRKTLGLINRYKKCVALINKYYGKIMSN